MNEMREEGSYRQMELNTPSGGKDVPTADHMRTRAERARQEAEYFEQKREQLENQQQEIEISKAQRAKFSAELNEVGMKIHNATRRLEAELKSIEEEKQEVEAVVECFKRHLRILSALQPHNWNTENFEAAIRDALPKLDRADNDFDEAYAIGRRMRHTDIFRYKPGDDYDKRLSWRVIRDNMLKGLAFHLPLFLLLLLTWFIYLLVQHSGS